MYSKGYPAMELYTVFDRRVVEEKCVEYGVDTDEVEDLVQELWRKKAFGSNSRFERELRCYLRMCTEEEYESDRLRVALGLPVCVRSFDEAGRRVKITLNRIDEEEQPPPSPVIPQGSISPSIWQQAPTFASDPVPSFDYRWQPPPSPSIPQGPISPFSLRRASSLPSGFSLSPSHSPSPGPKSQPPQYVGDRSPPPTKSHYMTITSDSDIHGGKKNIYAPYFLRRPLLPSGPMKLKGKQPEISSNNLPAGGSGRKNNIARGQPPNKSSDGSGSGPRVQEPRDIKRSKSTSDISGTGLTVQGLSSSMYNIDAMNNRALFSYLDIPKPRVPLKFGQSPDNSYGVGLGIEGFITSGRPSTLEPVNDFSPTILTNHLPSGPSIMQEGLPVDDPMEIDTDTEIDIPESPRRTRIPRSPSRCEFSRRLMKNTLGAGSGSGSGSKSKSGSRGPSLSPRKNKPAPGDLSARTIATEIVVLEMKGRHSKSVERLRKARNAAEPAGDLVTDIESLRLGVGLGLGLGR